METGLGASAITASELVRNLTLEQKASLCSGADNWNTEALPEAGIPELRMADGPHGLRIQARNVNSLAEGLSEPATCFPAACCAAASFDRDLLYRMGSELGRACRAAGVDMLLGPGVNIKRSPLCGRNFEYFSEDPLVAGELGAAMVKGMQSEGIGACVKHFYANSQEHRRMVSSSNLDERTAREIYLPAFETIVREAKPWSIMASYNRINGIYAVENKHALTDLLRAEWGFDGMVVSDWGAVHDRAAMVAAGCNLAMPSQNGSDRKITEAVRKGTLDETVLDHSCEKIVETALQAQAKRRSDTAPDLQTGHDVARIVAENSIVLLKNEHGILPLKKSSSVAFIGLFAENPRFQGGGSSHVNATNVVSPLQAARNDGIEPLYAAGYDERGNATEDLLDEAAEVATQADVAIVFAGLPGSMETEGVDRTNLDMPEGHVRLIERVSDANPHCVVVLANGAPILMPWIDRVRGIVECYLAGEASGEATWNILAGKVNPSGHLPETFPKRLQDTPPYLYYGGENGRVDYVERHFVGYRHYVSREVEPLFSFGHGLSYTTFRYSDLRLSGDAINEDGTVTATVSVQNTGDCAGKALVQLYVAPQGGEAIRPVRELKGFEKIKLQPGEIRDISIELGRRAFTHWSEVFHDWRVESGTYLIQVCEDAATVVLSAPLEVRASLPAFRTQYSVDMSMGDLAGTPDGRALLDDYIENLVADLVTKGYMPQAAFEAAKQMAGGRINLAVLDTLAKMSGGSDAGGTATFLGQPVTMLLECLDDRGREEFLSRLDELKAHEG